ncbi:MAG: hypothetical protein KH009_03720 [Clostridiales bacterium]|nr:hypothetical protein [Clostridiales bacterium]
MTEDKYSAQKEYLKKRKQLRVWVDPEKYAAFAQRAEENGQSIHSIINQFIEEYSEKKK